MVCRKVAPRALRCPGADAVAGYSRAAVLLRIQEGVEQRHAGEADGELLRGFHLGLRLFVDALPLNRPSLLLDGSGWAAAAASPGAAGRCAASAAAALSVGRAVAELQPGAQGSHFLG